MRGKLKFALMRLLILMMIILFYYLRCSVFLCNDNTKDNYNMEDNNNIEVFSTEQPSNIYSKIKEVQGNLSQRWSIKTLDNKTDFLFPYPNLTFEANEMLKSHWVINLKKTVEEAKFSKQVTFLMVSFDYFSMLLNWLAHAKLNAPSLMKSLLVVCLDEKSHIILTKKGITSTIVKVEEVVKKLSDIATRDGGPIFHARVVVRLTVLRLLNYWGFDVLQMDIDALLIKNIQPIFDHFSDTDIISSTVGHGDGHICVPKIAQSVWEFCLCIGTILIRSNQNIGMHH